MQDILAQFVSFATLVFCLMVFALVWVQRRGLELLFPKLKDSKGWNEFWVPVGPLGTGGIIAALFSQYPYPDMFANSIWYDRAAYGIACGLLSGLIYKLVKKNLMDKINGGTTPTDTTTPLSDPSQV